MKLRKIYIFVILFFLMSLSSVLLLNDKIWNIDDMKIYNISVITKGKSSESLMVMKEGIEQASSEMDVNISFITLSEENSVDEQKKLIEREVRNGVDAILISPADYYELSEVIDDANKKVPIVLIDSKVESSEKIPYIGCDNYNLGASLAEEVIQMGNTRSKIAVIKSNLEYSSIKDKYSGFMDIILSTNNKIVFIETPLEDQEGVNKAMSMLKEGFDAIVAFDANTVELLGQCKRDINNSTEEKIKTEIYGTGGTSKITSFLEDDIIKAIAIQNEFNIGYLGVKMAVDIINNKYIEDVLIDSAVIDKRSMYTDENERLLFPLVK